MEIDKSVLEEYKESYNGNYVFYEITFKDDVKLKNVLDIMYDNLKIISHFQGIEKPKDNLILKFTQDKSAHRL